MPTEAGKLRLPQGPTASSVPESLLENPPRCPTCRGAVQVQEGAFFFRGEFLAGLVCRKCNACWAKPGRSDRDVAATSGRS